MSIFSYQKNLSYFSFYIITHTKFGLKFYQSSETAWAIMLEHKIRVMFYYFCEKDSISENFEKILVLKDLPYKYTKKSSNIHK